jgi:multimeric flavodoxin WrbA
MQVTTLSGRTKKKGNTANVLSWVAEEIKSLDNDVGRIYLNNKKISGCLGCARCRDYPDETACIQKNDAIGIMENMVSCDVALYASPVYFGRFSAQI